MQCGQAAHHPSSRKSKEQASGLWRAHYGPPITKETGDDQLSFAKWASQIEKGVWYHFVATDTQHQRFDIPNLLSIFAADHVNTDDGAWIDNTADVELASKKLQVWVSDQGLAKAKSLDELLVRSSTVLSALMAPMIEGIRDDVLVGSDGKLLPRYALRNRVVFATSSCWHY